MTLAPIVLFVYNRPIHARLTLEALAKNELSDQSILYIYADGIKKNASSEQIQKIQEVRSLIREKQWCKEVIIIEREENLGVDNSEIRGVTEIINKFNKVIVLEDDLITSVGFLKFMNDSLEMYEDEPSAMGITGYNFPIQVKNENTFFIKGAFGWGWATWKRAWEFFIADAKELYDKIILDKARLKDFSFNNTIDYLGMLKKCYENEDKPWDIRWYASVYLLNGYNLFPYKSLVQNIGWDNTGTHCGDVDYYKTKMTESINLKKIPVEEIILNRKRLELFFYRIKNPSIFRKVKRSFLNFLKH